MSLTKRFVLGAFLCTLLVGGPLSGVMYLSWYGFR